MTTITKLVSYMHTADFKKRFPRFSKVWKIIAKISPIDEKNTLFFVSLLLIEIVFCLVYNFINHLILWIK